MTPSTSKGFSVVDFSQDVLLLKPLPWQRWVMIHALELLPNGKFRYRTVLLLVARQNGKTSIIEVKNLWKMFVLRTQILGTAQNLDLSEESWNNAVEMVEGIEELAAEIKHVDKTNGKKALRINNGARWKVAAASRKGGRGFSGDDVNLDELREHQNWEAWGAVTKTTLARPNPQIWAYSNAGDDKSVVLNDLQAKGRAAVANPESGDHTVGLFEYSVPDDLKCDCKRRPPNPHLETCALANPEFWRMANPALGYTITEEALAAALLTDPDEVFLTECLCQRVPSLDGSVINPASWANLLDSETKREGDLALGVDIAPDRTYAAIGIYGKRPDGFGHLQVIAYKPGVDWVVDAVVKYRDALNPVAVAMGRGTAASLEVELKKVGIARPEDPEYPQRGDLAVLNALEMSAGCGLILDGVRQGVDKHAPDPANALDSSAAGVKVKQNGDVLVWARKESTADTCPMVSVTVAKQAFTALAHLIGQTGETELCAVLV